MKGIFFALSCVALSVALWSCKPKKADDYHPAFAASTRAPSTEYIFGIHPLHNPQRTFQAYGPLIDYLNKNLKGARIRLEASRDYASFESKLAANHFAFAFPNPYQALISVRHGYRFFGKAGNDGEFCGLILIRKDHPLGSVLDLRGKAVSYPAPTALAATLMPQWFFHINGLDVNTDIKNLYVGSQESAIMNAYLGVTAAAATWPSPWQSFEHDHPEQAAALTVRWQTPPLVNNALIVRNDVPAALVKQVSDLLFNLQRTSEGKAILSATDVTDFEPADAETYLPVQRFLTRFAQEVRPLPMGQP